MKYESYAFFFQASSLLPLAHSLPSALNDFLLLLLVASYFSFVFSGSAITKSLLIHLADNLLFCISVAISCTSSVKVHYLLLEHILYLTLREGKNEFLSLYYLRCLAKNTNYILMYFSTFRRSILKSYSPVGTMTVMPCIFFY